MLKSIKSKFFGGDKPFKPQPIVGVQAHIEGEVPEYAKLMEYYVIFDKYADNDNPAVVVIDDGVDAHSQLGELIENQNFTNEQNALSQHGTHVGGISSSIYSLTQAVPLVSYKALYVRSGGSFEDIQRSVEKGIDSVYKVFNMSLGASAGNRGVENAIKKLLEDPCTFLVVANGNDGNDTDFPSWLSKDLKNVISVASGNITSDGIFFSEFSDKDPTTLVAQGEDVLSTLVKRNTRGERIETAVKFSGTSMAAPLVSSVISLAKGIFKEAGLSDFNCYDFHDIAQMEGSCVDMDCRGKDRNTGYGFIMPLGFLENAQKMANGECPRPDIPVNHNSAKKRKHPLSWLFSLLNPFK